MSIDKEQAGKLLLKSLLEKQKLSADETEQRFQMACSKEYWQNLNPQLNVCQNLPFDDIEINAIDAQEQAEILRNIKTEKYFTSKQPLIKKEVAANMLLAVDSLRKEGWHELFTCVYDEFWQVLRTPSTLQLLSKVLGENGYALPHAVVHYVHPETGAGWSPHVDFSDRDNRFTLWFSISDATVDNGCMYVIPGNKISDELLNKWITMQDINHKEAKILLQATHALPVAAGSILGWEGDIIHWGTLSSPGVQPRVSLSVVYLKEGSEPMADELPLLSATELPDFGQRMVTIAKAINQYSIHVLAMNKFSNLAKKLMEKYNVNS